LEVNTVAQWRGLQSVSDVNIAMCIIDHLASIVSRTKQKDATYSLVEKYYEKNLSLLPREKQFHFYSRMYLTTKDKNYLEKLENLKSWYNWNANTLENSIKTLFQNSSRDISTVVNNHTFRLPATKKRQRAWSWGIVFVD